MKVPSHRDTASDKHAWLEDVSGERALDWVRAQNSKTATWAQGPAFDALSGRLREVLDARDKIPYVSKRGPHYYNLWRDLEHPRGLWRRTSLAEYRKPNPAWETVLDIDALGKAESKSWVFAGVTFFEPACERCMLSLSPGGSDAQVKREFDVLAKQFVSDGFHLPEAKSDVSWVDQRTLLVATDFGDGTQTTSGYPRVVKRWQRGTPLSDATLIFEGQTTDVSVGGYHDTTVGYERSFVSRSPTFFSSETFWLDPAAQLQRIPIPDDARHWVHRDWLLVHLRTPWAAGGQTYAAGALIVTRFAAFMSGQRAFYALFTPTDRTSVEDVSWTRDHLILNVLDDVKNKVTVWTYSSGAWCESPLPSAPALGTISVHAVEPTANDFFMTVEDFVTPTSLFYGSVGGPTERLKQMPPYFDASALTVTQHFTASADGTRIPYFEVARPSDTPNPDRLTLLSGYGGFEVSLLPQYSGTAGRGWLEQGDVYVVANIRGGGEYGPRWHKAALKQHRHRAYEDFAAVAQDLIRRGVTEPARLGIRGGSNGGLLMGNMLTQYPQLFGGIVCQVPLLDMQRYSHLLAGASWMGEYGDPDKPEEWQFIQTFSPYHNVRDDQTYPPTLFMTSTRDDRVHPGHARKMMEKMQLAKHDVHYYENIEGGHGGSADNAQAAHMLALAYTFLRRVLGKKVG